MRHQPLGIRARCLAHASRAWLVLLALLISPGTLALAQSGANWNSVGPPGGTVLSLLSSPRSASVLYAGTAQNGIFMSADAGQTWSAANAGLPATGGTASRSVRALASDGQYLYAATEAGIFYSAVGAMASDVPSWTVLPGADKGSATTISLLAFDDSTGRLFAAASTRSPGTTPVVYAMSVPVQGAALVATWPWPSSPLPSEATDGGIGAMTVVPANGSSSAALVVGAVNRMYVASVVAGNAPLNWIDADPLGTLLAVGAVEALHYSGDFSQAYACSSGQLFRSSNPLDPQQNPWLSAVLSPTPPLALTCNGIASGGLGAGGPATVAVATSAGVYVSYDGTNFGATSALGLSRVANALAIAGSGAPALYVGAGFGVTSQALAGIGPATAWSGINGPAAVTAGGSNGRLNNANVTDSAVIATTLFAAVTSGQYSEVLSSTDAGATWASTGLSAIAGDLVDITALSADAINRIVYAGTGNGLFARPVAGGAWVAVSSAKISSVVSLAPGAGALYVGTDAGVFRLPLDATPSTATAADAGLAGLRVSALHVAGGKVYAGTYDFSTTLASVSVATEVSTGVPAWSEFATGAVDSRRISSLAALGTALLAATRGGLVSVAEPGGSWTPAGTGLSDPNGVVTSLFNDGTTVFAATGSNGIFTSPAGTVLNWTPFDGTGNTALPSLEIHRLRADGTSLYAATAGGLATFSAISASTPPTPPPAPAPAPAPTTESGGGALGGLWLLMLALLVALIRIWRTPAPMQ